MSGQEHVNGDCWPSQCLHCMAEEAVLHEHDWTESTGRQANLCPCGAVDPWYPAGFDS